MPESSTRSISLSRWFRGDPFRDLFRVLSDAQDEAMLVIDAEGRNILNANHALLLLSGYARDELETLDGSRLLHSEDTASDGSAWLTSIHLPEARFQEFLLETRDGLHTAVDLKVLAVGSPATAYLIEVRPSESRLKADQARQAQHERLHTLAEITTALLDGTLHALPAILPLAASVLCAEYVGVYRVSPTEPHYLLEGELPEAFPPALSSASLDPLHRPNLWTAGQRPRHPLQKAARAAGVNALRTSPIGVSTAWIGLLIACWRDAGRIPEDAETLMHVVSNLCHAGILVGLQRAAVADLELEIRKSREEIQRQFQSVGDALLILSSNLHVAESNDAAGALLGYSPQELAGRPIQDVLVSPHDVMSSLLDALGHERVAEIPRLSVHRRDGTPVPVRLRAVPFAPDPNRRLLVSLTDQSERQAIEDQHELLAQRALLGEVSAIFAHEVRNPINNISTGVQLVASRLGKDNPLYETLDRVKKECTRLDQLMTDVLFFARPLELKIEPTDIRSFLERILGRWTPRFAQAKVTAHPTFGPDLPQALLDPRTFEQVVVNLITNALQAMPDGGALTIGVTSAMQNQGAILEIKIADTGPGIPQAVLDRIFDPFFTTKKNGTGLGLAISRRILAAHKGRIQVESYPDAGTLFTIHLPAA